MSKVKQNNEDAVPLSTIQTGRPVSEEEEYEYKSVNYKDFFRKKKYIPWWILSIVITVLVSLLTIHHDEIVEKMRPISLKIRELPGGFVIPIAILVLISFPPLFGHEIIALLVGVVYGLWIGFAIVAAGTFIGETGTWFAFKYAFRKKAIKLEKTNLNYGALARLTRDGGFWIVLLIRFSVIPSHFSTAVFSTCGVNFWFFEIATFLTLPKQIILVYVGVILTQEQQDNKINSIVLGITFIVTVVAGIYIYVKMRKVKKMLLEEQASRKTNKEALAAEPNEELDEPTYRPPPNNFSRPMAPPMPPPTNHWQGAYEQDTQRNGVREQEFI